MAVSCHRHFFPVLLLNQQWSPPLTLQASHCSTFRIVCAVPSVGVFCSESIECFPGTASKFFLKLLVTIPVAPIITGTTVHFIIIIIIIIIIEIFWCARCKVSREKPVLLDRMVLIYADFELLSRSVLYRDQTILIIFMEGTVLFTAPGALSKPVVIRGVNSNFCY